MTELVAEIDELEQVIVALQASLSREYHRAEGNHRNGVQNLAVVLLAQGGQMTVSRDLVELVFGFDGDIDIDVASDENALTMNLVMTEACNDVEQN